MPHGLAVPSIILAAMQARRNAKPLLLMLEERGHCRCLNQQLGPLEAASACR